MERTVKSAERTLRLFELFSRRRERLTVSEIARELDMPQPSASMLLANLTRLGYVEKSREKRTYAPTLRVVMLGCGAAPHLPGAQSLAAQLEAVHEEIGEDIFVGMQNGAHAQIVQVQAGERRINIDSGQLYPLTCAAIGHALLATKRDPELLRLVRRCNADVAAIHRVNESEFLTRIWKTRLTGYAHSEGYIAPDRASFAVTVCPPNGMVYGIGCAGPRERIEAKRELILNALRLLQTIPAAYAMSARPAPRNPPAAVAVA